MPKTSEVFKEEHEVAPVWINDRMLNENIPNPQKIVLIFWIRGLGNRLTIRKSAVDRPIKQPI